MEPSVRGDLGRAERKLTPEIGQGDPGGAPPGPLQSPLGERLGEPQSPTDCVESHPYLFSAAYSDGKHRSHLQRPGKDVGHARA